MEKINSSRNFRTTLLLNIRNYKTDLGLLTGIASLTFFYFIDFLALKRVLYEGDAALVGYAVQYYATWSVKQGIFPFWNPYFYFGYPAFAESQGGILYPSHLLFYLLPLAWFRYLFHLNIAVHYFWTAAGVYVWMRRWTGNPFASAFSALTFEFSGFMAGHIVHPNIVEITSWAPWILWMFDRWRHQANSMLFFFLSLFLSFQILAGHYTTFLCFLMGFFLYAVLFSMVDALSRGKFRFFLTGISGFFFPVMMAHLLTAVQVFPQVELSLLTTRVKASPAPGYWHDLKDLFYLFKPYPREAIAFEISLYIGIIALLVLVVGLFLGRFTFHPSPSHRLPFLLFILIGVFFGWMAMGVFNPIFRWIFQIPPASYMRNPVRFFLLSVDLFLSSATSFVLAGGRKEMTSPILRNRIIIGLSILQTLSLFLAHFRYSDTASPSFYDEMPPTTAYVKPRSSLHRVFPIGFYNPHSNRYEHFKIHQNGKDLPSEVITSYLAHRFQVEYATETMQLLIPSRTTNFIYRYINHPSSNLYNLSGIQYVIVPSQREMYGDLARKMGWNLAHRVGYADIYENPSTLPRAFIVHHLEVIPPKSEIKTTYVDSRLIKEEKVWDVSNVGRRLLERDFDPASSGIVEEPVPLQEESTPPGKSGVKILSYTPSRVEISVETSVSGFLVLTDSYYPGWRARVNGKPVKIYRTDDLFRGVVVPAGTSTILFSFLPTHFYLALFISMFTFAFLMILAFSGRKRPAR